MMLKFKKKSPPLNAFCGAEPVVMKIIADTTVISNFAAVGRWI